MRAEYPGPLRCGKGALADGDDGRGPQLGNDAGRSARRHLDPAVPKVTPSRASKSAAPAPRALTSSRRRWDSARATAWRAAGKQLFLYHCIEPSGGEYLNTFIERPRTQGRLLYWLASLEDIDGWLYYATDLWRPYPGKTHSPIRRIGGSARTDFDPSNYIWSPRTDIFANGDGQFVYPGAAADGSPVPIGTARLELQRDAVEDISLIRLALRRHGHDAVDPLVRRLVRSPTDHTDDPAALESARRAIAALATGM